MVRSFARSLVVLFASACCCSPPPAAPEPVADEDEAPWEPVSPMPPTPPPLTGPALGPDGLPTEGARAHVVAEINELCPDTFCEGDFDWVFDSLACRPDACTLSFHARYYEAGSPVLVDHVEITGWTRVVDDLNGTLAISEPFWAATCEAISTWEDAHRPTG